jgi:hypothetical protein
MACCGERQDKQIYKGQSATFRITITDEDGERYDLTGATLYFRVKVSVTTADPALITKVSSTPAQITILAQSGDTVGQAEIYLLPADTTALTAINYVYDVWILKATGEKEPVVPVSALVINLPVTNL